MIGKRLGHHSLLEQIGRGGMGEVFLARDERLGRKVALKMLPPEMAADPERLMRFEREAKAVAALNHPNIVTIHSVEEAEGVHFITMELVQGQTLTDLIPREGFTIDRLFEIAIPLAEAVNFAHKHGITHRDLKPDNIKITPSGQVKVLDFGLAKLHERHSDESDETVVHDANTTQDGRILGTVNYMSPEQAQAQSVDHRSDIFSLGIIMFEMATGRRPFRGETSISILSSILKDTAPSVTELKPSLPLHLGRIISRSLVKDPDDRYHSAHVISEELSGLKRDLASGILEVSAMQSGILQAAPPVKRRQPWLRWALMITGGAALLLFIFIWSVKNMGGGGNTPPVAAETTVAVMEFRHGGGEGEAAASSMLAGLVQVGLIENSPCRVITREYLKDVRRRLFGNPQDPIAETQILELGRTGGAGSLIIGNISQQGDGYLLLWQLVDAGDGSAVVGGRVKGSDPLALADGIVAGVLPQLELSCGAEGFGEAASVAQLTTRSPEAYRHYDDGLRAMDESQLEDAESHFLKAVLMDSTFALAYTRLADVATARYKIPEAKQHADAAWNLRRNLGVRDRLKLEATRARLDMNESEWLATNEEILGRYPDDRDALQAIIGHRYQQGFLAEAAERSAHAAQLYPDDRSVNTLYAYILAGMGRLDEALAAIEAHVQQRPDNANGWDTLGDIRLKRGEPEAARVAFQQAISLAPDFGAAHRNLARCDFMAGDLDGAIASLEQRIERADEPESMLRTVGIWLGTFYRAAGRFDDAERILQARMPEEAIFYARLDAQIGLAYHYLAAGEGKAALAILEDARPAVAQQAALAPVWSSLRIRGLVLVDSLGAARELLTALQAQGRDQGPYSAPRAAALESEANIALAAENATGALASLDSLRQTLGGKLSEPRLVELAVAAHRQLGQIREAQELLGRALPEARGWARYYYLLGLLAEERGKKDDALAQSERFLEYWQHADADRVELEDARRRRARLGGQGS